MTILVLNGPNLNILGKRDLRFYGRLTLSQINKKLRVLAAKNRIKLIFFQSNSEGEMIDFIQSKAEHAEGILINPGALTHYGYSLRDSLQDTKLPIIEVHLSKTEKREIFRKINVLNGLSLKKFSGAKEKSYLQGLMFLIKILKKRRVKK